MTHARVLLQTCALLLTGLALPTHPLAAQAASPPATETAVPVGGGTVRGFGPNGATLRCRDGFLPPPGAPDAACAERGGVLARYPLRRPPQRAAATAAQDALRADSAAQARASRARTSPDSAARAAGVETYAERRRRADSLNAALRPPVGATLRCEDGTWIVRDTTRARCATRGGVQLVLPPQG